MTSVEITAQKEGDRRKRTRDRARIRDLQLQPGRWSFFSCRLPLSSGFHRSHLQHYTCSHRTSCTNINASIYYVTCSEKFDWKFTCICTNLYPTYTLYHTSLNNLKWIFVQSEHPIDSHHTHTQKHTNVNPCSMRIYWPFSWTSCMPAQSAS